MRETMERERSVVALAGGHVEPFDSCPIARRVLRAGLLTAWRHPIEPAIKMPRPWRLGTDMVAPEWMWKGLARVVNDPDLEEFVEVWTRKAHRAWRKQPHTTGTIAAAILRGEITDGFWR
jgi:hypothetical protein